MIKFTFEKLKIVLKNKIGGAEILSKDMKASCKY